jgi:hypothetical protein
MLCGGQRLLHFRIYLRSRPGFDLQERALFHGSPRSLPESLAPSFDPESEVPKEVPVWVRLPNLPIHCWNSSSLQAIGNGLGNYIDKADPKDQYSCARICVEVNLEVGLPEAVKLKVGEWQHFQKLDYEQLPFKCRGCHEYGHFQRNCPKEPCMAKDTNDGWQQVGRERTHTKTKGPRSEKTALAHQADPGSIKDTRNSGMETDSERINETTEVVMQPSLAEEPEQQRSNPELVEISSQEKEKDQAQDPREPGKALATEEGEISTGSSSEEDSSNELTPKKPRRGRKSKIAEREKETYKDVLNGSQPTIKQLINVRQTRKKSKAFQGGHNSPSGNQ